MPRLTSVVNGSVASVSDKTAELLGSEWVAAEEPKQDKRTKK